MSSTPPVNAAAFSPALAAHRRPRPLAADGLSKVQYRGVVCAIALAHIGAIWGVLQVPAVREAVVEAAPIFVDLLAPPPPPGGSRPEAVSGGSQNRMPTPTLSNSGSTLNLPWSAPFR